MSQPSSPAAPNNDSKRFIQMTRIFMNKVAEIIYQNRCPHLLSDATPDEDNWFDVFSVKSQSLRQAIHPRGPYGYFMIEVMTHDLTIERWIVINYMESAEIKLNSPEMSPKSLKRQVYVKLSTSIRALIAVLSVLPFKNLEKSIKNLPSIDGRFKAVCGGFCTLKDIATTPECFSRKKDEKMWSPQAISTPTGTIKIICYYIHNVGNLLMHARRIHDAHSVTSESSSDRKPEEETPPFDVGSASSRYSTFATPSMASMQSFRAFPLFDSEEILPGLDTKQDIGNGVGSDLVDLATKAKTILYHPPPDMQELRTNLSTLIRTLEERRKMEQTSLEHQPVVY